MNKGKKFLSAVLAVAMTASLSVTAFAATTVISNQYGTIQASNVISTKTETISFLEKVANPNYQLNFETGTDNGEPEYFDKVVEKQITYSVIPVGTVITTTPNQNYEFDGALASSVIYYLKESTGGPYYYDDHLTSPDYTITDEDVGRLINVSSLFMRHDDTTDQTVNDDGTITVNAFTEAYFMVDGSAPAVTPAKPANTTKPAASARPAADTKAGYKSDTGKHLDVNVNGVYQFKITSLNGKKPSFQVAGKAFQTTYKGKKGNDYFYLVKAVGKVGQYGGVYINGEETASTTISIKNNVKSDTGAKLTVKPGKVYQFKLTAGQKPTFVAGNPKAFTVTYNGKKGSDYFYLVKAVGHSGQSTGLYINGAKTPSTVAQIGY